MKRHEAVTCLREINNSCRQMSPDAIALVNSPTGDQLSTGYQVHIQTILDSETKSQIQSIAQKHSLAMKEEKGKVVIYQPKPPVAEAATVV
jgi:hypothetical protein